LVCQKYCYVPLQLPRVKFQCSRIPPLHLTFQGKKAQKHSFDFVKWTLEFFWPLFCKEPEKNLGVFQNSLTLKHYTNLSLKPIHVKPGSGTTFLYWTQLFFEFRTKWNTYSNLGLENYLPEIMCRITLHPLKSSSYSKY
jgi:hypothetical protein